MQNDKWLILLLALGLGLLVGMQRQSAKSKTAGIRTFPLITLTGTICGFLAKEFDGWILAVGLIAIAALLIIANVIRPKEDRDDIGITTEMAAILMYAIGAYLVFGERMIAVVITGVITVLLHFKSTLHGWIGKFGQDDLKAIMQFVLISMIILPVLPNETYDKYDSLNPNNIWLMVVLIVGIGLIGYFIYKFVGNKAGVLLGGILGGLISSTATTVSYSRMSRGSEAISKLAAFVILTASAVSLVRVMIEISVVAPSSFKYFIFPLGAELLAMIILVIILFFRNRKEKAKMPTQKNPADFVVVKDVEKFEVLKTFIDGELVAENGSSKIISQKTSPINKFSCSKREAQEFAIRCSSDVEEGKANWLVADRTGNLRIPVIEALEGQLITNKILWEADVRNGKLESDIEDDILKIVVVNRYKDAHIAKAFINNFKLLKGAIASSVAHDSHNIVAVGVDDDSICKAVNLVIEQQGGISAVSDKREMVLGLPVAGLMSNEDGYRIAEAYTSIDKMAKEELGSTLASPFMTLSFMALLVIPHLKLSDLGLFDGDNFRFV